MDYLLCRMNGFHYLYTQITNLKDMQDVNHLKMVLVEQKKGGIHDLIISRRVPQQMVIRRIRGQSFHRFKMAHKFIATRHRDISQNLETIKC